MREGNFTNYCSGCGAEASSYCYECSSYHCDDCFLLFHGYVEVVEGARGVKAIEDLMKGLKKENE